MPDEDPHPSVLRVQRELERQGVTSRIVVLPQSTRTAKDAAAAIGCSVAQIAKSLVFRRKDSDTAVLVIASGANRVDEQLVSACVGAALDKADADLVRSATGFAIGGVPPIAHDTRLLTIVDEDLLAFDVIWAAGGTPHAVFSLTPADLVRMTAATVVRIAAR